MDREARRQLEQYRCNEAGPSENALIDDFIAGEFDRRELLRRASILGVSIPAVGLVARALGEPAPASAAARVVAASASRIRVGIIPPPSGAIEPSTVSDIGGLQTAGIAGEYLVRATQSKVLVPELALSWSSNPEVSIWTFKLRPNVVFQTGQPLTADDVVATWKRLASPGSQALSAVGSYLGAGGVQKVDDLTVAFHLNQSVSNFPYLVSSTTYQGIILPADYELGTFTSKPQTTGAFELVAYTPGVGATYNRFGGWWNGAAPLAGVDVTYYSAAAAADAALLGGQIDLVGQVQLATDRSLFNNSSVQIFKAHGATHREVPLRVDDGNPLADYRVRQAIALTLDRPAIIKTLFDDLADIGNDSPFAPVYGLARSVPQRKQNISKAKQLIDAAGHAKVVTLVLLSMIIFFAGQVLPGQSGKGDPRALRLPAGGAMRSTTSSASTGRSSSSTGAGSPGSCTASSGTSYQYQAPVSSFIFPASPLAEAGGRRLRDRGAPQHPRRRHRRPEPGRLVDRVISTTSLSLSTVPEFVSGVVLIVVFAISVQDAAGLGERAARLGVPHPAQVPDPSGHPARVHPLRLHRPNGPGRHRRGARLRLRPHGHAEGPAAAGS
jgi:peptide/nickel transport system substrate-binding protein